MQGMKLVKTKKRELGLGFWVLGFGYSEFS